MATTPERPDTAGPKSTPDLSVTPIKGPQDLARLRASADAAAAAERARVEDALTPRALGPASIASAGPASLGPAPGGPMGDGPQGHASRAGWMKVAIGVGAIAALATVGVTTLGGETKAASNTTSAVVGSTTTEPDAATADSAPTTAAPTTAPTTTAAAAPVADPLAPPPHKAVYRGGKLYLEGSVNSDAEAQKYIAKATAVLGADNVVNNYLVDPNVAVSTDGTVYVDEPFLFESGSSALNPSYTGVINLGIAAMTLNPNARMAVTGHTDSKGDPALNLVLSQDRANAVVDFMVSNGGLDRSRFDAVGMGGANPIGDNNTEAGRQLNRRIEVKLLNLLG